MDPLVSVITPSYNSERHIEETLRSLMGQTFDSWEVCVTDDFSSDRACEVVTRLASDDSRIRLFRLGSNSGAAVARNNSLAMARGRFIAYLDSDDIWYPEKLERQLAFMKERKAAFSCASYEVINEDGRRLGKQVRMLDTCDYMGFLTNNLLQTVGIMVDTEQIRREMLVMPDLRRRQDAATWLGILRSGFVCHGVPDILCGYRRVAGSLSSNKFKAVRGMWHLYRRVERLSLPLSLYCFARYASLAVWKRMYAEPRGDYQTRRD